MSNVELFLERLFQKSIQYSKNTEYLCPVSYTHLDVYKRQGIDDKLRLQQKAWTDYNKACEAWQQEQAGNHKEPIKKWGEIFGSDFPTYG